MAKKTSTNYKKLKEKEKTEKNKRNSTGNSPSPIFYEISILVTVAIGLLLFLSNFGLIGLLGDFLSGIMFGLFGFIAFLLPLVFVPIFIYGFYLGRENSKSEGESKADPDESRDRKIKVVLVVTALVSISVLMELIINSYVPGTRLLEYYDNAVANRSGGGLMGGFVLNISVSFIGILGTYIATIIILLICLVFLTGKPLLTLLGSSSAKAYSGVKRHHQESVKRREEKRAHKARERGEYPPLYDLSRSDFSPSNQSEVNKSKTFLDLNPEDFKDSRPTAKKDIETILPIAPKKIEFSDTKGKLYRIYAGDEEDSNKNLERDPTPKDFLNEERNDEDFDLEESFPSEKKLKQKKSGQEETSKKGKISEQEDSFMERPAMENPPSKYKYSIPPMSLLSAPKKKSTNQDAGLIATAQKLEKVLLDFGVKVNVINASSGPSVTRYELQPEQGVKVSRIVGLVDDIKLNLAVSDLRIEAPIPGKAAVGIEVPNKENTPVMLRELLESDEFKSHPSNLAFAVGKDIAGKVMVADIAKMPHLLIAGSTGSGKSVCINTLIMSILYKASPDDVKLIMIDPKVVELSVYNGIPHLLYDVVTDPKKAAGALNWAVAEMTKRYQFFAELNVRDLKGYNKKVEDLAKERAMDFLEQDEEQKVVLNPLPQIVIIVDELADLMMVAPGDVEGAICRLAQLARAAGLHLIVATQRPSVNVITGLIKANMPSRIAFAVASGVDSRTIIDMNGAEKLLGRGDMLFYPSGYPKPVRVQGSFISDGEVHKIVDFLKNEKTKSEKFSQKHSNQETEEDEILT